MRQQTLNPEQPGLYEPIQLPVSEHDIGEIMRIYREFIDLPYDIKSTYSHIDPDRPRTGNAGYMHKGVNAPRGHEQQDNKQVFHYSQAFGRTVIDLSLRHRVTVADQFIDASAFLFYAVSRGVKERFVEMEAEYPLISNLHFPRDGTLAHHLRFIAYEASPDEILAKGHYDKSTVTVAVAESHGGLQIGEGEDDLIPLERSNFEPIMFQGYGWHQLMELLDLDTNRKAGWHNVVDTGEAVDENVQRWAVIGFMNLAKLYLDSTTDQTHTPIRWRNSQKLALPVNGQRSFLV